MKNPLTVADAARIAGNPNQPVPSWERGNTTYQDCQKALRQEARQSMQIRDSRFTDPAEHQLPAADDNVSLQY